MKEYGKRRILSSSPGNCVPFAWPLRAVSDRLPPWRDSALVCCQLSPLGCTKDYEKNKHVFLCTVYLDLFFPHYGRILLNHNINVFIKDTTQWIPVSIKDEDNLSLTFFLIKWEIYKDEIHFYFFSGCWTIIICNILYPIFLVHFSFPI